MQMEDLEEAIRESWGKDTCYPAWQDRWSPDNPALGQCLVTSLVVQDYFKGELVYCKHNDHYWNLLTNGKRIDFTKEQFPPETVICIDDVHLREDLLENPKTKERYELLKKRVMEKL